MNPENLVSLADRPLEERQRIGAMGGKKSGESKREKKLLRQCIEELMEREMGTGIDGNPISGAEAISTKLFKKALDGDVRAFEVLRDTAGQKPVEKVMVADVDQSIISEVENMVLGGTTTTTTTPAAPTVKTSSPRIVCRDKKTKDIVGTYETIMAAQNATGVDNSNIGKCLRGKAKSAGGYLWEYE